MNSSSIEFRRNARHSLDDMLASSPQQQAEFLMRRDSFTLDDPHHDVHKPASASLMALSKKDRHNFFLLVLLYFLQGIPMGLAMGSVPFLLKYKLSYGEIGVFTLASYPYSMKLLWSPIVDAIWSPRMGRRKSWIVPVQAVSAIMLLWLGGQAEKLMEEASQQLYFFTWVFFCLVMLCATQDIAVDGMFPPPSHPPPPVEVIMGPPPHPAMQPYPLQSTPSDLPTSCACLHASTDISRYH